MKKLIIHIFLYIIPFTSSWAQENGRIALSANIGLNGNFSVKGYDESGPGILFYEKSFVGFSGGAELKYKVNNRSYITLGYMQSKNLRVVNFFGTNNGIALDIMDFTLRHTEHIFYLGFERSLLKRNPGFKMQGGIYYVEFVQQEIELLGNSIYIWERTKSNSGLNDMGVFIGFQYSKKIDRHFELGIQSRFFYTLTSNSLDQLTLTPTLTYHFSKSKRIKKAA